MTDLDSLKSSVDLISIISGVVQGGHYSRNYYQCACPLHGGTGRTPSLTVWQDHYNCFSCGAHGSIIDWYIQYEHLSFKEAVNKLKQQPHSEHKYIPPVKKKSSQLKMTLVNENFANIEEGLPYFEKRKISSKTAYRERLGVTHDFRSLYQTSTGRKVWFTSKRFGIPNIFDERVRSINYRRDDAAFIQMFKAHPQYQEVYEDLWLVLGHQPKQDEILDYCAGPKYRQQTGSIWRPFNVGLIKQRQNSEIISIPQRYILLHAESKEFDCLSMMDAGYPTMGITLSSEVAPVLPELFSHIPLIYIIRDNDDPGLRKAINLQSALGRGIIISPPRDFKDSGEVVQAGEEVIWMNKFGLEPYLRV